MSPTRWTKGAHAYKWQSSVGTRRLFATLKLDRYLGRRARERARRSRTEAASSWALRRWRCPLRCETPTCGWWCAQTPSPPRELRHPEGERRLELGMPRKRRAFFHTARTNGVDPYSACRRAGTKSLIGFPPLCWAGPGPACESRADTPYGYAFYQAAAFEPARG